MSQNPGMNAPYGQQPGYPAPGTVPAAAGANVPAAALQIIGGVVAVIAAFLSWAALSANGISITVNGMGNISGLPAGTATPDTGIGDGALVIAAGVLAILGGVLLIAVKKGALSTIGLIGGLGALALGIYEMTQVNDAISQFEALGQGASGSVGIGIWLVIAGGAVALIGAILGFMGGRKRV